MNEKEQLLESWKYEFKDWIVRFGSYPIRLIASKDFSESYEANKAHLFELENHQTALVIECGCSCYCSEDASIELFPDVRSGSIAFGKWILENQRHGY